MRRTTSIIALLASIALLFSLATSASADPPGNNGDIKIHAGDTENEPMQANEPHPGCSFHIHGFNFDASSSGTWRIVAWPPTGDGNTVVKNGTWSANASGEWRTAVISDLASGRAHFKAFAKQNNSPGGEKQKVFWTECGAAAGGQNAPQSAANASPSPSPTQLGFQQAPMGAVSPIVETPAQPAVAGAQQPPAAAPQVAAVAPAVAPVQVAGLPSTSTDPVSGANVVVLAGPLALLLWRRLRR